MRRRFNGLTYQDLLSEKRGPSLSVGAGRWPVHRADDQRLDPRLCRTLRVSQYPRIAVLRDTLKTVFTDADEQYWDRLFGVRLMDNDAGKPVLRFDTDWVAKSGAKGLSCWSASMQLRIQALNQTIARLWWAEEERRVVNYDGEVEKLRQKLRELQTELNSSLVGRRAQRRQLRQGDQERDGA